MNGPETVKHLLVQFWNRFGERRLNGDGYDRYDKLTQLKWLSSVVIPYRKQQELKTRRKKFDDCKHKLHPFRRFKNCFVCGFPSKARHHIIPLINGGINSKKNLVSLCDNCHAAIHPWLK